MQTVNAIICYVRDNGGIIPAARKVIRLACKVTSDGGLRGLFDEIRNTARIRATQADQAHRMKILRSILGNKKVTILATPHTLYVAHMLAQGLSLESFSVSIITAPPVFGYGKEVHIVLCPQMFSRLPRAMVAFQMEQSISSRWFSPKYLRTLSRSLAILDYSQTNITFLIERGIPYKNIFYLPIHPLPDYQALLKTQGIVLPLNPPKEYDVLFYGDTNCPRRQRILEEIGKHFRLEVVGNLFGEALCTKILQSRVVINIHYYEGALLETTRVCECLSLGVPVISEIGADQSEHPELTQMLKLVKIGDTKCMIEAIREVVGSGKEYVLPKTTANNSFHLLRFLTAFGLIEFDRIAQSTHLPLKLSSGKVCLSLPETPKRRAAFSSLGLRQFEIFDGLRHAQGWIGCALSYKFLAAQAKARNLCRITICEDDVILGSDSERVLATIESYLDSIGDEWDVFAGLIAHLHSAAQVTRVVTYRGLTFVHLDKMTSTVLNIYNHTIFGVLAGWNPNNQNASSNTIDRYLEHQRQLQVITTLPFIAGHAEQEVSTLWGFDNSEYSDLIRASQTLLSEKVDALSKSTGGAGFAHPAPTSE